MNRNRTASLAIVVFLTLAAVASWTTFPAAAGRAVAPAAAERSQATPSPWEFLSTTAIGARQFRQAHPEWDGRGVVIAVCDTGVEPGVAGLRRTTTGEAKILDARDFSGEGDVQIESAVMDRDASGPGVHAPEGHWLRGLESLTPAPDPGPVWIGYLDESAMVNSKARDLDGNGRTNDVFGVVVYTSGEMTGTRRRIVVDTDGDGRLDDEEVRADFREDPRFFALGSQQAHAAAPALSLALNLWKDEPDKVTFFFDDGAHGSHVSGIAAGHDIGGEPGQDGIAPGARILALKLGDNTLSGGATTPGSMWKAWNYAADYGRRHEVPVVIQMSYGVGSEQEGASDMEAEIDRLLEENESLVGCVSNGNEGPGLSTAGLPSCARYVIASGAVLNRATARDLYGVTLQQDRMFSFSSRGAETAKPDVVTPGFAASTVPPWRKGRDVMRGTSMASPQTSGAAALILSAARAEGLPLVGAWVRAALRRGAVPLPDTTVLDQGPGMVNVPRAWEVYRALAARPASEPLDWTVETYSPELPGRPVPAAHWRGVDPPAPPERQEVKVTPRFRQAASAREKSDFYRAFDLVSTAAWVRPDRKSAYTRSGRRIEFALLYDPARLSKPGLYTARLLAYPKGSSRSDREKLGPEWDLPVSVVVPYRPAPGDEVREEGVRLDPGAIHRTFVRVPPGATGMQVRVRVPQPTPRRVLAYLHDPEGRRRVLPWVGGDEGDETSLRVAERDLQPGTWEVVLYGHYENGAPVTADLAVRFDSLALTHGPVHLVTREGAPPKVKVTLTGRGRRTVRARVEGKVTGYRLVDDRKVEEGRLEMPLHLDGQETSLRIRVSMTPETWNRFTDVAVRVLDADGKAVLSDGMTYAVLETSLDNPHPKRGPAEYTLQVLAAEANPDKRKRPFHVIVERTHLYRDAVPAHLTSAADDGVVRFDPDHPVASELELDRTPPAPPKDGAWVLELSLADTRDPNDRAILELEPAP